MVVIFDPLSRIMAEILRLLYAVVPNYGWDIVLLTLVIKIVLFPTSISQVRSMEVMKVIQPKTQGNAGQVQRQSRGTPPADDGAVPGAQGQPARRLPPLLIQLPFLFALFGLLRTPEKFGIVLKNVYFLGLLLTAKGNAKDILGSMGNVILAVLSAVTTFLQTKMISPAPQGGAAEGGASSMQNTFLYFMPMFFGYITFTMEAAIGIYWVAQASSGSCSST